MPPLLCWWSSGTAWHTSADLPILQRNNIWTTVINFEENDSWQSRVVALQDNQTMMMTERKNIFYNDNLLVKGLYQQLVQSWPAVRPAPKYSVLWHAQPLRHRRGCLVWLWMWTEVVHIAVKWYYVQQNNYVNLVSLDFLMTIYRQFHIGHHDPQID